MALVDYDTTAASNTSVGGLSLQEGQTQQKFLNDQMRAIMADVKSGAPMQVGSAAVLQAWDFTGASATTIPSNVVVSQIGLFRYDSTDTTTSDNGSTVLVTASGERYKIFGGGADPGLIDVIDTYAAARLVSPATLQNLVYIRGKATADDPAGGWWYKTTEDLTGLDNDGTILAYTTDPTAGGLRRVGVAASAFLATWFGCFGVDATDYSTQLTNAHNAMLALEVDSDDTHKELVLPAGKTRTDNTYALNEDNVGWRGEGRWLSRVEYTGTTGDFITIGGTTSQDTFRFSFRNIQLAKVGSAHTSGAALNIEHVARGVVENVLCDSFYQGFRLANAAHVTLYDCRGLNTSRSTVAHSALFFDESAYGLNNNIKVIGFDVRDGAAISGGAYNACIHIRCCDTIFISDSHWQGGEIGVRIQASTLQNLASLKFVNTYSDTQWDNSMSVSGSFDDSFVYSNWSFIGCLWRAVSIASTDGGGTGHGVVINGASVTGSPLIDKVMFSSNIFRTIKGNGLYVINTTVDVSDVLVKDCTFEECNIADSSTQAHIVMNCDGFQIATCDFYQGEGAGASTTGGFTGNVIRINSNSDDGVIWNNNLLRAIQGAATTDQIYYQPIYIPDSLSDNIIAMNNAISSRAVEHTVGQTRWIEERLQFENVSTGSAQKVWGRQVRDNSMISVKVFGHYFRTAIADTIANGGSYFRFAGLIYREPSATPTGTFTNTATDAGTLQVETAGTKTIDLAKDASNENEIVLNVTATTSQTMRGDFHILSVISPISES